MGDRLTYVRPSWFERHIMAAIPPAARLMSRLTGDAVLQVRGRHSGQMRTTLARTITVGESRYLVAIRGETQWARNLRAVGQARLWEHGRTIQVRAIEAHGEEKRTVIEAFVASSKYAPTRRMMSETLPDPDQHPVFRIEAAA
ncbi:MAG: nitroreductase family deazaflavin-dependent oxidoreductase [Chloroflexi bacterium]|nr:MAG: nitroreductase family deazaflavin-dependent oxidoreductase [Chloroflexota bacterium]TMG13679.1 MAG: nitroreductase family deazaflavin-dependent oxidoreductase [Chloroflexota bacterium]